MTARGGIIVYEKEKTINSTTLLARSSKDEQIYVLKETNVSDMELYRKLGSAKSKYISHFFGFTTLDEKIYAVLEYVEGVSLEEYIRSNGVLSDEITAKFAAELADALFCIHVLGIIHRDVNPKNIVVTTDGDVKIIDFGIMRFERENQNTDTQFLGTPQFAAPEQYGFKQTSNRTDIYSLGVVINYMLTGEIPNEKLAAGDFRHIILKCTEMDAEKRYKSARQLKRAVNCRNMVQMESNAGRTAAAVVLILYYIAALCFTVVFSLSSDSFLEGVKWFFASIFALWLPLPILFNFKKYLDKLKFTRKWSKSAITVLKIFLAVLSVFIGMLLIQ